MKIDRRSFISLIAGGAVGTALTPLPLKLMDDSAIWTQSFRYLPIEVPVPPDGPVSYHRSVCTLCPGGCGLSVRKIGQRAVKIEGQPEHPLNNGHVCALGLTGLQLLYGPWRVQAPMKKVDGRWQKITWETALSEIAAKLKKLRQNGRAQAISGLTASSDGTVARLLERFLTACGSPNFLNPATSQDSSRLAAQKILGKSAPLGYDFERSSFVLSFASGLLDGWGSPVRMAQVHSLWKDKEKTLVQVEPRLSHTAAKADQWVPINPGTEAELALGMAQVIIRDHLYDRKTTQAAAGFANLKSFLDKNYTPEQVAKITKVETATIEKLARRFAKAANPVAVCGRGNGRQPVSVREAMAVLTLNLLVGSLNRQGGPTLASAPDYINWDRPVLDEIARQGLSQPRWDGAAPDMPSRLHRLPEVMDKQGEAAISALLVAEANPAYTLHNAPAVQAALKKIPLVVSLSAYLDETAALADYILPLPTYLERREDVPVTAGLANPVLGLTQPVVKPLANTRHPGDVILGLARQMGGSVAQSLDWRDYAACLKSTLGDKWSTLADRGYLQKSPFNLSLTPSTVDLRPLVKAASHKAAGKEAKTGGFPLTLVPYDSMRMAEDNIGTPPFALKTISDDVLKKSEGLIEINPATAGQYSLSEGQTVTLKTPLGSASVKVHLSDAIAPQVVAMPRGLGHTAYDEYLSGKGVNINTLVAPVEDPVSGMDVAWGIRAKLT